MTLADREDAAVLAPTLADRVRACGVRATDAEVERVLARLTALCGGDLRAAGLAQARLFALVTNHTDAAVELDVWTRGLSDLELLEASRELDPADTGRPASEVRRAVARRRFIAEHSLGWLATYTARQTLGADATQARVDVEAAALLADPSWVAEHRESA